MKNMTKPNWKAFLSAATRKHNLLRIIGVIALIASLMIPLSEITAKPGSKDDFVYVGTYTRRGVSKGIYGYRFTPSTGDIVPLGLMAEAPHPSYLIVSPNQRFLYSTNEHENATDPGNTVTAYARDVKTGTLTLINKVSSKGMGPAHIAIDKTGKFLAVANFGSGSMAVFALHVDGSLGEATAFFQHTGTGGDPVRQAGPHAHCVLFSPDNRFLLVAEHGLDKIFVYKSTNRPALLSRTTRLSTRCSPDGRRVIWRFIPMANICMSSVKLARSCQPTITMRRTAR